MRYSCPLSPNFYHPLKFVNRLTTRIAQQLLGVRQAVGLSSSMTVLTASRRTVKLLQFSTFNVLFDFDTVTNVPSVFCFRHLSIVQDR